MSTYKETFSTAFLGFFRLFSSFFCLFRGFFGLFRFFFLISGFFGAFFGYFMPFFGNVTFSEIVFHIKLNTLTFLHRIGPKIYFRPIIPEVAKLSIATARSIAKPISADRKNNYNLYCKIITSSELNKKSFPWFSDVIFPFLENCVLTIEEKLLKKCISTSLHRL